MFAAGKLIERSITMSHSMMDYVWIRYKTSFGQLRQCPAPIDVEKEADFAKVEIKMKFSLSNKLIVFVAVVVMTDLYLGHRVDL